MAASPYRSTLFQSTHPVRGGTTADFSGHRVGKFQSTHPVRGGTRRCIPIEINEIVFQSTHPVRGGTQRPKPTEHGRGISIHPPREGWDC